MPLKNKGGYTDEVRKFVSALNSADLSEKISFAMRINKYTKASGQEAEDLAVYGNYPNKLGDNGKPASTGFIPYSDIPKPISKVVAGDTVWDFTPQTEFYYDKINELENKFKEIEPVESEPNSSPSGESNKEVDDDLPF